MLPYHEAFWAVVATSSVLLALGYAVLAPRSDRPENRPAAVAAVFLVLGVGVTFALGMTSLGLRRDFVRPLWMAVAMSCAFMGLLGLLAARTIEDSKRGDST